MKTNLLKPKWLLILVLVFYLCQARNMLKVFSPKCSSTWYWLHLKGTFCIQDSKSIPTTLLFYFDFQYIQLQYIYITIPLTVQCTQLNIESILFVTAPVCECAANVFGKNQKQYIKCQMHQIYVFGKNHKQ